MQIIGTSRKVKSGKVTGIINVGDGARLYAVKYERNKNGHSEQWGAHTEVLSFTYSTFEKLVENGA